MTTIYSPRDKGFGERQSTIDRAQVVLLREIMGEFNGLRMVLKGGMAMRAVVGSMRLTKDIDFDRDPSVSIQSLKGRLRHSLKSAGSSAGMREISAEVTKETLTTVRARLSGRTTGGEDLRFDVEVSGRSRELNKHYIKSFSVTPPGEYGMANFVVASYTPDMLAAMKISAAMSDLRNAPRDIYDLYDLLHVGADPVPLLTEQAPELLAYVEKEATRKLDLISYALAREELLAYLPTAQREELTEDRWIEMTLEVGEALENWARKARQAQEPDDPPAKRRKGLSP